MIQRCQRLVGGILAFLVLLALHLIHGSTLLLALFLHLINHVQLTTSSCNTSTSNINEDDVRLWKQRKVPKCLGVIFVPSARGYFSFSSLRYKAWDQEIVFQGMAKDVLDMVLWCKKLEVDTLLLYDENGTFFLFPARFSALLTYSPQPTRRSGTLSCVAYRYIQAQFRPDQRHITSSLRRALRPFRTDVLP